MKIIAIEIEELKSVETNVGRLVRGRASDIWNRMNGRLDKFFFRKGWGYDEPPTCAAD